MMLAESTRSRNLQKRSATSAPTHRAAVRVDWMLLLRLGAWVAFCVLLLVLA